MKTKTQLRALMLFETNITLKAYYFLRIFFGIYKRK